MVRNSGKKPKDVMKYSLWLLQYRPRSVAELREALRKKQFTAEEIDPTLEKLLDWGYLDDAKYTEYLIHSRKTQNVKGRAFVARELQQRGVDSDELDSLYSDEEECELIANLIAKWQRQGVAFRRDKYFRRLASRGFAIGNIFACLDDAAPTEEDPDYEDY